MIRNSFGERLGRRQEIIKKIEILRCKLACLVETKGTMLDPEVLAVSQELDLILIEYYLEEISLKPSTMG